MKTISDLFEFWFIGQISISIYSYETEKLIDRVHIDTSDAQLETEILEKYGDCGIFTISASTHGKKPTIRICAYKNET